MDHCENCDITKNLYTKPMKYGKPIILCEYCMKKLQVKGMTRVNQK